MAHADDNEIDLLARHLTEKYSGTFDDDEIREAISQARGELEEQSSQSDFLPVFIQRRTEELLHERAGERGLDLDQVQQILFLDDRNTGRSQIAAAVANGRGEGMLRARSGGIEPGEEVHDRVVQLLEERGYGAEEAEVTPMTGKAALASDVVGTLGLTDEQKHEMPAHGLHQIDWDDLEPLPADADAEAWSGAMEEIERRVEELVTALLHDRMGDREVEPEVEEELDEVLGELHEGED